MKRTFITVAGLVYALVDFSVIMAPSIVLAAAAEKGGLSGSHGVDLLIASAVVGAAHASIAFGRLTSEARIAKRRIDAWIAGLDALVVLTLGVTLLLIAVLGGFADEHDAIVNRGWPVVGLWVGVQLSAVALAEVTGWLVFRWLEPDPLGERARQADAADQAVEPQSELVHR